MKTAEAADADEAAADEVADEAALAGEEDAAEAVADEAVGEMLLGVTWKVGRFMSGGGIAERV